MTGIVINRDDLTVFSPKLFVKGEKTLFSYPVCPTPNRMKEHIVSLLGILLLVQSSLWGQVYRITGNLTDAYSGEKLDSVLIREKYSQKKTYSDEEGFFQLELPGSYITLRLSLPSYHAQKLSFMLERDTSLQLALNPLTVATVEIVGRPTDTQVELNKLSLSLGYFHRIPSLLGESDPLKTLSLFPGVQTALEGSSGLVVRGGYPGQNLILLDEMNLYNPYHLLGISSTFHARAIQRMELYKGMFPARYGNRIAAVMDLQTESDKRAKKERQASIGLLSSSIYTTDTLAAIRGDYMLAGRLSYLSLLTLPMYFRYKAGSREDFFGYWLYDANARVNATLKGLGKLRLSVFFGNDHVNGRSGTFRHSESKDGFYWGNSGLSLTHHASWAKGWEARTVLALSHYRYSRKLTEIETEADSVLRLQLSSLYRLTDMGISTSIKKSFSPAFSLAAGISGKQWRFFQKNELNQTIVNRRYLFNHWWEINWTYRQWAVRPGIRMLHYPDADTNFTFIEPRLSLSFQVGKSLKLSASVGKVSQSLHLVSGTNLGLPNDIWMPASRHFPLQRGHQYALGVSWGKTESDLLIQIEGYYRKATGLVLYRPRELEFELLPDLSQQDDFLQNGEAESFGLESLIKYQSPYWQAWISYTFSKSDQRFTALLDGRSLPTLYDQRHNLQLVAAIQLSEKLSFSPVWQLHSGRPAYLPMSRYIGPDGNNAFVYPESPARFPIYHRLDIGFTYQKAPHSAQKKKWQFGVYNAYNRKNPLYLQVKPPGFIIRGNERIPRPGKITGFTLLPFTPYISYQWIF